MARPWSRPCPRKHRSALLPAGLQRQLFMLCGPPRRKPDCPPSACCRIGGLLGGIPLEQVEALTRYGLDIGVAFQISDDSLDFVANQERLGKAIGSDLREGKLTLPLIAMLERCPHGDAESVRALLGRRQLAAPQIEQIRRLVLEHEGVEYAHERASSYAQAAKADLEAFPPSDEREILALIADFVVNRDR